MFERYTEKARRVIFFARYEASQFGASQIEAEHILLGLIREDKNLTNRFFHRAQANIDLIRKEIEGRTILRDRISTNIDLPLSSEAKRVLNYAIEESERLGNRHIGTEHLLLGLMREENSIAAEIRPSLTGRARGFALRSPQPWIELHARDGRVTRHAVVPGMLRAGAIVERAKAAGVIAPDLDVQQCVEDIVAPFLYRRLVTHTRITARQVDALHRTLLVRWAP